MRTLIVGLLLMVGVLLSACDSEAPTDEAKETASLPPCPDPADPASDPAEPSSSPPTCQRVTGAGGLEARDGYYQFHVNIPAVDGSNDTVRDDSGCNGPINRQTTPWMAGSITAGGSGDLTNPRTISGSWSAPRTGGEDTVTWSFTLPE